MRKINIDDKDLVIIVKDSKVYIFQNGKQERGITHIDFTATLEEIPKLNIEKYICKGSGEFEIIK